MDELNEHRDSSSWLSNELEEMINLNEKLAATSDDSPPLDLERTINGGVGSIKALSQRKRSQLVEHLKELRLKNKSRLKANEFMLINRRNIVNGQRSSDARNLDHHLLTSDRRPRNRSRPNQSAAKRRRDASLFEEMKSSNGSPANNLHSSLNDSLSQDEDNDDADNDYDVGDDVSLNHALQDSEWTEEVAIEIMGLLRKFHTALQHRRDAFLSQSYLSAGQLSSPNSADDSGISADDRKYIKIAA